MLQLLNNMPDDIMRAQEDNQEYYRVPPRGKHYVEKWAHDDMLEEQRQGKSPRVLPMCLSYAFTLFRRVVTLC